MLYVVRAICEALSQGTRQIEPSQYTNPSIDSSTRGDCWYACSGDLCVDITGEKFVTLRNFSPLRGSLIALDLSDPSLRHML